MNKLIYILLFIPFIGFGQPYPNAGLPMVRDTQWYVVDDGASNGDYVGQLMTIFLDTVFNADIRVDDYTWSIVSGNTGDAFSLTDSMIVINDATDVNYGSNFSMVVQCCNNGYCENTTAYIYVLDEDSCVFIDPSYSGTESGTRAQPYNHWTDISSKIRRFAYLQQRNDTVIISSTIGSFAHGNIVGAYGQGHKPYIETSGTVTGEIFYFSSSDTCSMYDFYLNDVHTTLSSIKVPASYFRAHRLYINNDGVGDNNIVFYSGGPEYVSRAIYDSHGLNVSLAHNFKAGGCHYDSIINCFAMNPNNTNHAFSFAGGDHSTGKYLYATRPSGGGGAGVEINDDTCDVRYVFVNGFYRGVFIGEGAGGGIDSVVVMNAYVDQAVHGSSDDAYLIEDDAHNILLKNCVGVNSDDCGLQIQGIPACTYIDIQCCIFTDNADYGVEVSNACDYVNIDNCIFYNNTNADLYDNTSGTNLDATNCCYQDNSGFSLTTCLDLDGITMADYFYDYSNGDWRLKSTAVNAIDAGTDVGITEDFIGISIPQGAAPDIGAYEYQSGRKYPYLKGTKQDPKLNGVSQKFLLTE